MRAGTAAGLGTCAVQLSFKLADAADREVWILHHYRAIDQRDENLWSPAGTFH
jgi:hypothetical protein